MNSYTHHAKPCESLHDAITAMFDLWNEQESDEIELTNIHPMLRPDYGGHMWRVDYWLPTS